MATRETMRPIVSLMTQAASELAYLVQTEFRLARAEISEKLSAASSAAVYLVTGGAFALSGFIVILFDIAQWITVAGLAWAWSLLIVGGVTLVSGAILALLGVSMLRSTALTPQRTIEQMREDYAVAREHIG
jgi:hypothetical protein